MKYWYFDNSMEDEEEG